MQEGIDIAVFSTLRAGPGSHKHAHTHAALRGRQEHQRPGFTPRPASREPVDALDDAEGKQLVGSPQKTIAWRHQVAAQECADERNVFLTSGQVSQCHS